MSRPSTGPGGVILGAGPRADLVNWHRFVDPMNRFGFVWINSSGTPKEFSITGGPGRPADVPGGFPRAVVMIHSYSAADLADPDTIAGRWLARGAFIYYGSVNEPFLQAFRPPRLVAEMLAAELPMAAALRQLEFEPHGRPWRLIYLGDPLYRLEGLAARRATIGRNFRRPIVRARARFYPIGFDPMVGRRSRLPMQTGRPRRSP